jgi:hypothetical protein
MDGRSRSSVCNVIRSWPINRWRNKYYVDLEMGFYTQVRCDFQKSSLAIRRADKGALVSLWGY